MSKILLYIAGIFVSHREAARWLLNYLLVRLSRAKTDKEWNHIIMVARAIHGATGIIIEKLEDRKVTRMEQIQIEAAAEHVFDQLFDIAENKDDESGSV